MSVFKIIALRVLDGCPKNFRKCLDNKKTYFFDNCYEDVVDTDFIRKNNGKQDLRLYDIKGYNNRVVQVEVSAIVGKNGEGKSTLIELMLRILNNFACTMGFRASQDTLRYVKGIRACLFYGVDNIIYTIRCDEHGTRWFQNGIEINICQGTPQERMDDMLDSHQNRLFYSLVINYALYSYNSNLFAYETPNIGSWLDGLFHKNDSYQTPLVINPMRTGGNINVNKELDLSIQRLMAVFTEAGDNKDQRIVSDGVEAYGFAFSLDKGTKLLDVTLGQYFKEVADDECHLDDLDGENAVEVAQEMFYNFQEFFSSFNELLDKNDRLMLWLSAFEIDNTPRHRHTDLAGYVDTIARAYEEDVDIHSFNMTHEMKYFVSGKPLRWMNYAQLYRVLFLLAVWEVLREINVVKLSPTLDKYLEKPNDPINKATLYIPYKIIEILSTYEPYKKRSYHYDASCEAMKLDWPTSSIKKELKRDIESILRKDDYTTLKLHQTINYLKEQKGMYQAEKTESTPEGYEWFVPFARLKTVIKGEGLSLSELVKKLPPPIFKGEIELKNDKGETYVLSTLSSGQMQRLNSAGALVYHLRNLDYRVGEQQRLEYDYVSVIFEEVELYFHPEFQRTLINYFMEQMEHAGLRNIRGIHLIFVTHSPFILTDMLDSNVMYLSKDGKQKPDKRTFAANIYDLLDDHFFLEETIGDVALKQINDIVKLYHQQDKTLRRVAFLEKKPFFRQLIDQIADSYLRDDVTQMFYEMLSEYAPNDIQDEIARTQQHLDELKARINNIES